MHKLKPLYQSDATLEQVKVERAMGGCLPSYALRYISDKSFSSR
jgi:hypothetical protein